MRIIIDIYEAVTCQYVTAELVQVSLSAAYINQAKASLPEWSMRPNLLKVTGRLRDKYS